MHGATCAGPSDGGSLGQGARGARGDAPIQPDRARAAPSRGRGACSGEGRERRERRVSIHLWSGASAR